jgi:hypothetical protein
MENWTEINGWSGLPVPDRPSVEQWLNRLPLGSEIQQIGLAFRRGRVQPRVLLNIPETGEVLKLLDPLKVPKALIEQKLEEQMLIAAAYPHPTSELMGLEILADRCGVNNLRQMRRQPQFRGSKTERLLKNLLPSNEEAISRLSSIEGRSSRLVENGIHVTLRGINHLKAVLSQGTLKSMKAYLGEVNNHFQRTSGGIAAR